MKPVNEKFSTTEPSCKPWYASIVKPYKKGWTNLKRAFGPVNQLRANNLGNPINSDYKGTNLSNFAHRVKFIGLAIPLLFPFINIIPIAHIVNQIYINLFSNEDGKKALVKPKKNNSPLGDLPEPLKPNTKEEEVLIKGETPLSQSDNSDPFPEESENPLNQQTQDSLNNSKENESLLQKSVEEDSPDNTTPPDFLKQGYYPHGFEYLEEETKIENTINSLRKSQIGQDIWQSFLEETPENQNFLSSSEDELNFSNTSQPNENLLEDVLQEESANQDPLFEFPEEQDSPIGSQLKEDLMKPVEIQEKIDLNAEKDKGPVPLHIELFNKALELQAKNGSLDLLQIIENLVKPLNINQPFETIEVRGRKDLGGKEETYESHQLTQRDNLKIQLLSHIANPDRLFNEIQKEFSEKKDGDLPDSMIDLLKSKIKSYNLLTSNALILHNDRAAFLYGSKEQAHCLSFAVFENSKIGRCKIEIEVLEKAVLDRIIHSLLEKSSISPLKGIGEQMNKEIESYLKDLRHREEKKTEIWTDFANTYVSRFVAPFLHRSSKLNPLDPHRVGLMTRFEEEIGSKTLRSNFEEFQQMMLTAYLTKQKSLLAKKVQSDLNQIKWNEPRQNTGWLNFGEQKTREQLINEKQKVYLDDLKTNIKTILTIDFPESNLSDLELDNIINEIRTMEIPMPLKTQ